MTDSVAAGQLTAGSTILPTGSAEWGRKAADAEACCSLHVRPATGPGGAEPRAASRTPRAARRKHGRDRGVALFVTVMALFLVSAVAFALALSASVETMIAANYRRSVEALFAADAGLERAEADLRASSDWNAVLEGLERSTFVDGPPSGVRPRPDGAPIDLDRETAVANCGSPAGCSDADLAAVTRERPWGASNPHWQLYAHGPLAALLPGTPDTSLFYLVVWVADDPAESDGDPLIDHNGTLLVRSDAFGPSGAYRSIEATLARRDPPAALRVVSWRDRSSR